MGYESKIYFVRDYGFPEKGLHHSEIVAMLDVSKMGYNIYVQDFLNCFDTETEFSLYLNGYDKDKEIECLMYTSEDEYGSRLKYASDTERLYLCAKKMKTNDNYWRFKPLVQMIKVFKDFPDVKIVHFGY